MPAGKVEATVDSVELGALQEGRRDHLLRSPSEQCNRMLQVADLHGVVSRARKFNEQIFAGSSRFLTLHIRTEPGQVAGIGSSAQGGSWAPVDVSQASIEAREDCMLMHPPLMKLAFELAGIEVPHGLLSL